MNKRNYSFKNCKSRDGSFSCHIKQEANALLTLYCKINELNKTKYINDLVMRDMENKFSRIKMFSHEEETK